MNSQEIKKAIKNFIVQAPRGMALIAVYENRNMAIAWTRYSKLPDMNCVVTLMRKDNNNRAQGEGPFKYIYDGTMPSTSKCAMMLSGETATAGV